MRCLALFLVSGVLCFNGQGEDWPEFRGPTGQGHSAARRLPVEWSASNNIAWKQPIPGRGWSSPVVGGGRIVLTTAVTDETTGGLSLRALALDPRSGKPLWNYEVFAVEGGPGAGRKHNKNTYASPTPILDGRRIFVHFGHLGTACLDTAGKVIWRNTDLKYSPVHGNGGSPALAGDALVFSCDGQADPFVVALDKRTGQVLWRQPRNTSAKKNFSFSTPLLITANGRRQLISPGSDAVMAYDPASGRELWRATYEGYSVVPRPVFGHGLIFFSTGFDRPSVIAVRPAGEGDVTATHIAWRLPRGAPNTPSLLLVGEELYAVSDGGIATCLDARTGEIHWQERLGGNYSASPLHAAGRIYFLSEEGVATVLKAGKTFEKLAANALGERMLASLAVDGDTLLIRGEEHLFAVRAAR
jgi:outer membrane protein assembly factor BamB